MNQVKLGSRHLSSSLALNTPAATELTDPVYCWRMSKRLTITISDDVYQGLVRHVGERGVGRYLGQLARPHVVPPDMEAAYREMARDVKREAEALEWLGIGWAAAR